MGPNGALRYAELFSATSTVTVKVAIPSPGVAGRLAIAHGAVPEDPVGVVPRYLRDPDAVANFTVAAQITR